MRAETPRTPRYSIIVAAYNVENLISDCLASLLSQQVDDYEIIIVNDGSTDGTLNVIQTFADVSRITLIDKSNGGLSDARNAGIDQSRGDYLMFVDGDDWIEPNTLLCLEKTLKQKPECDLLVFGFYEVHGKTRYPRPHVADFWKMTNSACNKLFARSLFGDDRFDRGIWYEDLAIVPALFARARQPTTVNELLYNYRRDRPTSIMNTVDFDRVYDLPIAAMRCIDRIQHDEATGRIVPMAQHLGENWKNRFLTVEIFIPGVLHRSRSITDRATRRRYIAEMMRRFPKRTDIRLDIVNKRYGRKMALGAALYRCGFDHIAHFILHDMGAIRCWAQTLLRSLTGAKRAR
ncbi:glycosyltransferase family 2 protein [Salinisphaera sp. SWV1]|uniref:glycosyltransferase family 2 protein n=1 Tax=Salinisphaera sp. SWV1 TaxID=3454139 RepID=UPI003F826A52